MARVARGLSRGNEVLHEIVSSKYITRKKRFGESNKLRQIFRNCSEVGEVDQNISIAMRTFQKVARSMRGLFTGTKSLTTVFHLDTKKVNILKNCNLSFELG